MNEPSVAIIVLTWNQRDLTLDCLASLAEMDYPQDALQVIVVDNGSRDGTPAAIHARFPAVTVLENGDNLGFAEGNNVGIRHALQGATEYIMLLNNDTVVSKDMLTHLVEVAHTDPTVGIVTPKIYYYGDPQRIWCAGASIDWCTGQTTRLGAEEIDSDRRSVPCDVDFASGCAICLKRQVIEAVGMLDPRFFIYYEETDWCVRVRVAGWRVFYVPRATLWHKVSSAMGATSPATDYYMNRNVLLFLAKAPRGGLARVRALLYAAGRNLITVAAYSVKSHGGQRLPNRNARLLALRDAALGHWGKMRSDVASVCYQKQK